MRLWELEFLQDYECGRSGVCCSDQWNISLTADEAAQQNALASSHADRFPGGALAQEIEQGDTGNFIFARTAAGRCLANDSDGMCFVHRTEGEQALARVCRTFPRHRMVTPRGLSQRVTPACTTVARRVVEDPGAMAVTVTEQEDIESPEVDFAAGGEMSPPIFGGVAMSWPDLWELEDAWVALCARPSLGVEETLALVAASMLPPPQAAAHGEFVAAARARSRLDARETLTSLPDSTDELCRVLGEILWRMALNTDTPALEKRSALLRRTVSRLAGSDDELAPIRSDLLRAAWGERWEPAAETARPVLKRLAANHLFANPEMFTVGEAASIFARLCIQIAMTRLMAIAWSVERDTEITHAILQDAIQFVSIHVGHDPNLWNEIFRGAKDAQTLLRDGLCLARPPQA